MSNCACKSIDIWFLNSQSLINIFTQSHLWWMGTIICVQKPTYNSGSLKYTHRKKHVDPASEMERNLQNYDLYSFTSTNADDIRHLQLCLHTHIWGFCAVTAMPSPGASLATPVTELGHSDTLIQTHIQYRLRHWQHGDHRRGQTGGWM